jgi:putative peptide zinc metalloprotease protein
MKIIDRFRARSSTLSPGEEVNGSLCPRAVGGIEAWVLYEKPKNTLYCVGSIEQDKYIAVPSPKVAFLLEVVAFFDGQHSIEWIRNYYLHERRQDLDVAGVYRLLSQANLITDPPPPHVFQGEFKRLSIDVVDIPTRRLFENLQPFARRVFKPLVLFTLVIIALGLASFRLEYVASPNLFVIQDSYLLGYLMMLLITPCLTLVHESSHAFTAAAYGAIARHIKVALYLGLLPVFYTEIAGLYTLKPGDRIKVWAAGCYSNICVGSIILLAYRMLPSDVSPIVGQMMLKVALGSFLAVVGNLFPLMPTDGYFILSTLLKQINLRTNAFDEFFKYMRGKQNKLKGALLAYFLATGLLLLGAAAVQVLWVINVVREIAQGTWSIQTLSPALVIVGLLVIVRIVLQIVARNKKKTVLQDAVR